MANSFCKLIGSLLVQLNCLNLCPKDRQQLRISEIADNPFSLKEDSCWPMGIVVNNLKNGRELQIFQFKLKILIMLRAKLFAANDRDERARN